MHFLAGFAPLQDSCPRMYEIARFDEDLGVARWTTEQNGRMHVYCSSGRRYGYP